MQEYEKQKEVQGTTFFIKRDYSRKERREALVALMVLLFVLGFACGLAMGSGLTLN